MFARYFSSGLARFMAVDPAVESIDPSQPQSWNRFAYAANNPIRYRDPDGRHNEEGHTKLTEDGLKNKMSAKAVKDVVSANLKVDENQGTGAAAANQHGMGGKKADGTTQTLTEAIEGTAKSVEANLQAGAESLLDGDVAGARGAFGAATHGAQDLDAGSHGGETWKGFAMTALTDPIKGLTHLVDDQFLMPGEYQSGVAATGALHGRFESTVRSAGEARGLSDASISDALKSFNDK